MSDRFSEIVDSIKLTPHVRVSIRPSQYDADRGHQLSDLIDILRSSSVKVRGWDFPYVGHGEEISTSDKFVSGSKRFRDIKEYWRLYKSLQFVHIQQLREYVRGRTAWYGHSVWGGEPTQPAPEDGRKFIDFVNTIYSVAERVDFTKRFCDKAGIFSCDLLISYTNIEGFSLLSEPRRPLLHDFKSSSNTIEWSRSISVSDLYDDWQSLAVDCCIHIFERFEWLRPSSEVLRGVIDELYSGRH